MKIIVTLGPNGLISAAGQILGQHLPEGAVLADLPETGTDLPPMSAAFLRDGAIVIVPNWLGSGPWFDQNAATADRLTPIEITEYGIEPAATWAMTPRAETAAEKKTRLAAEAEAAAAAEAARVANAVVSMAQFRKALLTTGMLDQVEAVMTDAATPQSIRIDWEYATEVRRAWPSWEQFLPLLGKTSADLDAVFVLAASL